ncbi:zinc-dependent alcohol dehydrogenase [Georgenia faecalis]|uniref:zinc-dependent alcohol dehydrogenase n=1 Tax=Georgenia faecalis TaxID=2483799 RepID=UPI000FD84B35|nr:zinc-binding dehydrogenase [Georgenia faecalis]
MRALRLHGTGDVRLHEEPDPRPGPDETLVRITDVGLCGSDLHWFTEGGIGDARIDDPLVPGHEMAGVVVGGPWDGRPVAVDPAIPCERCELCVEGHRNLCPRVRFAGNKGVDGGMQELLAWPTRLLHPLPEGVTGADGAMLEPLGVALHAWDLGHARAATTVAVVGAGPIGLLLVQLALAAGATRVIAVDPLPHRRAAALRYGAEVALDPTEARDAATWTELVGTGCDIAFEAAGTDDAIATSLLAVRPGARVALVGIPDGDRSSFPAALARRKGVTLVMVRRMKEMYPRTIALVASGKVDVRSLVTDRFPLAEAATAFQQAAAREGLKVVVRPAE